MTTEQKAKYKEAAKEYASESISEEDDLAFEECVNTFLAGASFAEKEKTLQNKLAIATSAVLKEALDKLEALQEELKIAKKEAHNAAIDQAIKIVAETRCRDSVHHELEKLKI